MDCVKGIYKQPGRAEDLGFVLRQRLPKRKRTRQRFDYCRLKALQRIRNAGDGKVTEGEGAEAQMKYGGETIDRARMNPHDACRQPIILADGTSRQPYCMGAGPH